MAWVYGVDASFDELTPAEAERLKGAGVVAFAQCLWTGAMAPEPRVRSLRVAMEAGLAGIGYMSIAPHHSGRWHIEHARDGVPDDVWNALVRAPVDVELDGLAFDMVEEAVAVAASMSKPPDIYTNYRTWVEVLGNPSAPANWGLWNAYWDGNPDVDFERLPFGDWTIDRVWGEQWSGGTWVEGSFVDRNQFREEALQIFVPPSTPDPIPPAGNYTREQGLWAIAALDWKYGIQVFDPAQSPADLHPFDKSIIKDLASRL